MVPDRQKVRTDGMDRRTDGRRQNYIPPTSLGDNKTTHFARRNDVYALLATNKEKHILSGLFRAAVVTQFTVKV